MMKQLNMKFTEKRGRLGLYFIGCVILTALSLFYLERNLLLLLGLVLFGLGAVLFALKLIKPLAYEFTDKGIMIKGLIKSLLVKNTEIKGLKLINFKLNIGRSKLNKNLLYITLKNNKKPKKSRFTFSGNEISVSNFIDLNGFLSEFKKRYPKTIFEIGRQKTF